MKPVFVFLFALLMIACGSPNESTDDEGGGGEGATTWTSSGQGGGGSVSSSSGGGGEAGGGSSYCEPTQDDPFALLCTESCTCPISHTTEPGWCNWWPGICPDQGNICSAGHNQCNYDLPLGVDYIEPECGDYVNGDIWSALNSDKKDYSGLEYWGGQLHFGIPSLGGSEGYDSLHVMNGKKIYWNRANAQNFESGEGEFSENCKTATMRYYLPGETVPYDTSVAVYITQ